MSISLREKKKIAPLFITASSSCTRQQSEAREAPNSGCQPVLMQHLQGHNEKDACSGVA